MLNETEAEGWPSTPVEETDAAPPGAVSLEDDFEPQPWNWTLTPLSVSFSTSASYQRPFFFDLAST